ncbi:DUF2474 domain-containing protein [Sphingomonas sp. NSE70-1]|uniref:DUF2474 domain-containing protein n=1 Tax=Sphingomonas caseinilyticus TaxID=2908205 RepID=A0ABT0RXR9_9SPHN|nr:DUF2474 domain-containing protein [Sphingomonas caseinilyticus]MCL6699805.1 DUF2474 domain-containing protein [Sphingomonas caseinilyticus]
MPLLEETPSKPLVQRLGWIALVWVASVIALAIVAWLIRMIAL